MTATLLRVIIHTMIMLATVQPSDPGVDQAPGDVGAPDSPAELLGEVRRGLAAALAQYAAVNCKISKTKSRLGSDGMAIVLRTDLTAVSDDTGRLRIEGSSQETGKAATHGVYIMDGENQWWANQDKRTGMHYLVEHGGTQQVGDLVSFREWVFAPYMFNRRSVPEQLDDASEFSNVVESLDDAGDRVVTIRFTKQKTDLIPDAPPSRFELVLYKDRNWAIKSARYEGVTNTGVRIETVQSCEYAPSSDDSPAIPLRVSRVRSAWEETPGKAAGYVPYEENVALYSEVRFTEPDNGQFDINQVVDFGAWLRTPRRNTVKWVFLGTGFLLFVLWFVLRSHSRRVRISSATPDE